MGAWISATSGFWPAADNRIAILKGRSITFQSSRYLRTSNQPAQRHEWRPFPMPARRRAAPGVRLSFDQPDVTAVVNRGPQIHRADACFDCSMQPAPMRRSAWAWSATLGVVSRHADQRACCGHRHAGNPRGTTNRQPSPIGATASPRFRQLKHGGLQRCRLTPPSFFPQLPRTSTDLVTEQRPCKTSCAPSAL